jgi:sugar (pentulose or hexulose) kinase
LIQECRRQWALEGDSFSYAEMASLAEAATPFTAFIDPDDPVFAAPGDMPRKIQQWCERASQAVPSDKGTILRVATESLALKYRTVFERFCAFSGRRFERLHAGGGGTQNVFLAQATANALGIEVIAGPVEATSCGNVIVQMMATGHVADLAAGRRLIRDSFDFQTYTPRDAEDWRLAYERFTSLISG